MGAAAGGAAGAAIGATAGYRSGFAAGDDEFDTLQPRSKPGFDHIVVVMGENRSFDNLLGHLYTPDTLPEGQTFDGIAFGDYSNVAPDGTVIPAHVYDGPTDHVMGLPNPDPGEEFPHVNTQLFEAVSPAGNEHLWVEHMTAPYNAPAPGVTPTNGGFVQDYFINYRRLKKGEAPATDQLEHIMGGFSPQMLPVLSTLAQEFAVFDHWFSAVPSQTFCNRSFFHASTSHGFVTNKHDGGYEKWIDAPEAPTIFNRLEEAGLSWKVYYDEIQLVSYTGFLHAPVLEKYWKTDHFATMDQFFKDVKNGDLPAYAFIEPRMTFNHNDFHPPFGVLREDAVDGVDVIDSALSDVRAGEALIHSIYSAIKDSHSSEGSNAINTMLLITFDEHGGTYDHSAPPAAVPPHKGEKGEMGFAFDRLGCRVPAIAVSAYTRRGTVINDEMHHGSVIKTLCELHGLKPLTHRDAGANDLSSIVNLEQPRHPDDWPEITPQWVPKTRKRTHRTPRTHIRTSRSARQPAVSWACFRRDSAIQTHRFPRPSPRHTSSCTSTASA
ncbi:alkaline phosphatase family protein [Microbacterium sp. CH12i]|uniref:alkaline phosphatase family protein n=1 Tax=Microbacterium sp. CH12i TaxID=1479651 RepID=UPI000B10BF03|nr:alkaline phosphatase family protein [Microbacterium sp. CH12i]